jgi:hypothetical protein
VSTKSEKIKSDSFEKKRQIIVISIVIVALLVALIPVIIIAFKDEDEPYVPAPDIPDEAFEGSYILEYLGSFSIYTFEEHLLAVESIAKFTAYRAESIRGQLDGTIPSTWDTQNAHQELLPDFSDYSPPNSGIMKILLPEYAGDEVSMGALLGVLPQANENLHESLSLPALLGLIDWGQLLTMEKPESGEESSLSKIPKEDLIAAVMPYPIVALKLLLTALAVPVVLLWGLRFIRRRKKTRGGITHVV